MKKLTAGIFAGILTIVTVNAARADIATTTYVNQNVNTIVGALGDLTTTNKDDVVTAINEVKSGAASATATALQDAKDYAKGLDTEMDTRMDAVEGSIETLKGDGDGSIVKMIANEVKGENGVVGKAINDAITGLTSGLQSETGSVVKTIKQTNGEVTATFGKVAKADLDTALTTEIDAKMKTDAYNTATTVAAGGKYVTTEKSVGENLTALDTQVKTNAEAITTLNGDGTDSIKGMIKAAVEDTDGVVGTAINEAVEALDVAKRAEANKFVRTITQTDGKVSVEFAAVETDDITDNSVTKAKLATTLSDEISNNTTITTKLNGDDTVDGSVRNLIKTAKDSIDTAVASKVAADGNLENMLLTADEDGQLANAATLAGEKPAGCTGKNCMLVSTGEGFEWQIIVDTYTKPAAAE